MMVVFVLMMVGCVRYSEGAQLRSRSSEKCNVSDSWQGEALS